MEPVLTPQAMGAADRRTIAAGTPVDVLMERAGRAVAWRVRAGRRRRLRRVVRSSCAARATTVATGSSPPARSPAGACGSDGVRVGRRDRPRRLIGTRSTARSSTADVVVDAMYGTGFRGRLDGDAAWVVGRLDEWTGPTVAVDIPSGVDGLTGGCYGPAVHARLDRHLRRPEARARVPTRAIARGHRHRRRHRHRSRPRRRRRRQGAATATADTTCRSASPVPPTCAPGCPSARPTRTSGSPG